MRRFVLLFTIPFALGIPVYAQDSDVTFTCRGFLGEENVDIFTNMVSLGFAGGYAKGKYDHPNDASRKASRILDITAACEELGNDALIVDAVDLAFANQN